MADVTSQSAGTQRTDPLEVALRARGLRVTSQRRLVADAVGLLGHATPEEICEQVQQVAPALSLSTVYRTLQLLEELGVVSHTHLNHGASTYHAVGRDSHIHLVCHQCGGIDEADVTLARTLTARVLEQHGFDTDLSHLSLHGRCSGCVNR
ncbi:MAG: Fur family transcriptional regulator [Kineosporiaceae bacterium]